MKSDIKALEKEIDRLRDKALDMYEDKYSKKCQDNHKRIQKLERQLKILKGE